MAMIVPLDAAFGAAFSGGFFRSFATGQWHLTFFTHYLECVSKIQEYAILGIAPPFLRHKARFSAAKPSDLFLELTKNPLGSADCPA